MPRPLRSLAAIAAASSVLALAGSTFAQVSPQCEAPTMLIVLDKSGSMDDPTTTGQSKWNAAQAAITNLMATQVGTLRFGFMVFPGKPKSCVFCSDRDCTPGEIRVPIGVNTNQQISTAVNAEKNDGGATPIALTMQAAKGLVAFKDPKRKHYIMLITDGADNCAGADGIAETAALRGLGVTTFVVGFSGGIDKNYLNNMAQAGGTPRPNGPPYFYIADSPQDLEAALAEIISTARKEDCDGFDNDCNGIVDDNIQPIPCSGSGGCGEAGFQECVAGFWTECGSGGGNALGDPCQLPGASGVCGAGTWGCDANNQLACQPSNPNVGGACEVPGFDAQCSKGTTQCDPSGQEYCRPELNATETPCTVEGATGLCAQGILQCDPNGHAACLPKVAELPPCEVPNQVSEECKKGQTFCENGQEVCKPVGNTAPEICDGLDNNCDGIIDNGPEEICDGLDNNCDGRTDEGQLNACGRCGSDGFADETCDGIDNDCDGQIDEGDGICVAGSVCVAGECSQTCVGGECPLGTQCILVGNVKACVADADTGCAQKTCPEGQGCKGGTCVDPCATAVLTCPEGFACRGGNCVENTCYVFGCDAGQRCVKGQCVTDGCAKVSCEEGQFCRCEDEACANAVCVGTCATVSCDAGQVCKGGKCEPAPCGGCPDGAECVTGVCTPTEELPCTTFACGPGRVCVNTPKADASGFTAECADDTCLNINCPSGVCCHGECLSPEAAAGQCPAADKKPEPDGGVVPDGGEKPDPECKGDDACGEGRECFAGKCRDIPEEDECESDSDCDDDQECDDGECKDVEQGGDEGGEGTEGGAAGADGGTGGPAGPELAAADTGCGCATRGAGSGGAGVVIWALAALAMVRWRRRGR